MTASDRRDNILDRVIRQAGKDKLGSLQGKFVSDCLTDTDACAGDD